MDVEYWHRYIAGTSAASGFLPPLACQYFHIHAAPSNPLVPVDLSVRLTFGAKRCSRTVAAGVGIVISRNDLRRFCRHNDDSSRFGRRELAYGRVVIPTLNIVVNLNDNCLSSYCTIRAGRRDRFVDLFPIVPSISTAPRIFLVSSRRGTHPTAVSSSRSPQPSPPRHRIPSDILGCPGRIRRSSIAFPFAHTETPPIGRVSR